MTIDIPGNWAKDGAGVIWVHIPKTGDLYQPSPHSKVQSNGLVISAQDLRDRFPEVEFLWSRKAPNEWKEFLR